jgi:hypothetical protein
MEGEEVYWVSCRDQQGQLLSTAATLVEEGSSKCVFKEYGTGVEFEANMEDITGNVADPRDLDKVPEDLVETDEVGETAVLWAIKKKFKEDVIYTNIGTILIALNPYREIAGLYSDELLESFKKEATSNKGVEAFDSQPHVWGISRSAYVHLLNQGGRRQAIIISGESGAGKTEATKKIMAFLSYVSAASSAQTSKSSSLSSDAPGYDPIQADKADKEKKQSIEHKVLMTNPLLESFGNAKTSRNDNSSRFGKWVEIMFDINGKGGVVKEVGAHITHYLLEKSRVVGQSKGERNFHIFYQLFAKQSLNLGSINDYMFLNGSGCTMIKGVNDSATFYETQRSLEDLNMATKEQNALYIALKGVLCLGNVQMENSDSSEMAICKPNAKKYLKQTADCLGLDQAALERALAVKTLTVAGQNTDVFLTPSQAVDARNALAKEIYNRLFSYVLGVANASLEGQASENGDEVDDSVTHSSAVGLLDIFGFEIFLQNSLEQLSINFANEKLQQYFLHFVIKREQEIYLSEGIDFDRIIPPDNQDVLDLFETPGIGIFHRLNEEVRVPKGADGTFLRKVVGDQAKAKASRAQEAAEADDAAADEAVGDSASVSIERIVRFSKDVKMQPLEFSITHFAGTVVYSAEGFVEKNKDRLFDHLDDMITHSGNSNFARMMSSKSVAELKAKQAADIARGKGAGGTPNSSSKVTLLSGFQTQLGSLMSELEDSNPHFVRCIKPNETKSSSIFNEDLVLQQLRYSGVLEAIQIRKKGYPARRLHKEFVNLYGGLNTHIRAELRGDDLSVTDKCELLVATLQEDAMEENEALLSLFDGNIAIGKSSVFFRHNLLKYLEKRRANLHITKVPICQQFGRFVVARRKVRRLREGMTRLNELISQSLELNGSNYQVHDALKETLRHCKVDLGMLPQKPLLLAKERLDMLEHIKEVMDEVSAMCQHSSSGADSGGRFQDVCEEHKEIVCLLKKAAALGFDGPEGLSEEVNELFLKEKAIATKAVLLKKLRAAIKIASEEDIRQYLADAEDLKMGEGDHSEQPLFVAESKQAKTILVKIGADNEKIDMAVQLCRALDERGDEAFLGGASSVELLEFQRAIIEILIGFKSDPPASPSTGEFIAMMRNYASVLSTWKTKSWEACSEKTREVRHAMNTLGKEGHPGKIASPTVLVSFLEVVGPLGHTLLHHVVPDIEQNLSLPQLAEGIAKGPIIAAKCPLSLLIVGDELYREGNRSTSDKSYFSVRAQDVSYDVLDSTVASVEEMELSSEDGLAMLPMLKCLVNVRRYTKEGMWMDVMRQTMPQEEVERWEREHSDMLTRLRDAAGATGPARSEYPDEELVPYVAPDVDRFSNEFFSMKKVASEFKVARKYAEMQLAFGDIMSVVGEGGASFEVDKSTVHCDAIKAIRAEGSFTEDVNSAVSNFVSILETLQELREHYVVNSDESWAAVMETASGDSWKDLGQRHMDEEALASFEGTLMYQCAAIVNDELSYIVMHCRSKATERSLKAALRMGNYNGVYDSVSFSVLEEVLDSAPNDTLLEPEVALLVNMGEILLKARKLFADKDLNAKDAKVVVDDLSAYLLQDDYFTRNLPDDSDEEDDEDEVEGKKQEENILVDNKTLRERRKSSYVVESVFKVPEVVVELKYMHADIDFAECLTMIEEGLHLAAPVTYVLPLKKKEPEPPLPLPTPPPEKEGTENDEGMEKKNEGEEAEGGDVVTDLPTPPPQPVGTSLSKKVSSSDPMSFLEADGYMLNQAVLSTKKLSSGLEVSRHATKYVKNVLPKHLRVIRCAELIKKMRDNVRIGNWVEAYAAFSAIKEAELLTTMPIIQAEVVGAADTINNYYVVIVCQKALSAGFARGKIGLMDTSKINTSKLDDASHTCSEIGCSNARAVALREAVWLLAELRRAQTSKNWNIILELVQKIEEKKIGEAHSFTEVCYEEVRWAKIERDNHNVIVQCNAAVVSEAIQHKESQLDIQGLRVDALQAAYLRGLSVKEKYRGLVLVEVLGMADIVLKARKAVQQSNWFALHSLCTLWRKELDEFQLQIENLELGDVSMARGGSILRRSSILTAKGPEEAVSKKVKMHDLWEQFAPIKDAMTTELLYIEQHFAMQELEQEINQALRNGGMTSDMIGEVDMEKVDINAITTALEKKESLESRGMIIPATLVSVFRASTFILKIRNMVRAEQWESMRAVLEESMTQGTSGLSFSMPDICRKELEYVRHESENRWIIANIEHALYSGALTGSVDKVDLEGVSFSHLVPIVNTCHDMTPRTQKAKNIVYTAEALIPLRRLLYVHPVDWGTLLNETTQVLQASVVSKLEVKVLPEIRLMEAVASERLMCAMLSQVLGRFGPKGTPGSLDLSNCAVDEIEEAVVMAVNTGVKSEKGSQLLVACRDMVSLRKALLSTRGSDEILAKEAWQTLRRVVMTLTRRNEKDSAPPSPGDAKTNGAAAKAPKVEDAGWLLCKDEVDFISKDAHVEEVRMNLVSNIKRTVRIYELRQRVPCDPAEDQQTMARATRKATDGSLSIHCETLTKILEYADGLDFTNKVLTGYKKVCHALKDIRHSLINEDFKSLRKHIFNKKVASDLGVVSEALDELAHAKNEYQNQAAIHILEACIKQCKDGAATSGNNSRPSSPTRDGEQTTPKVTIPETYVEMMRDYCRAYAVPQHHVEVDPHSLPHVTHPFFFMYVAIRVVQLSMPVYVMARELLECAVRVYQLRVGFASGDTKEVSLALKWLRGGESDGVHVPRQMQNEAKAAYVDHKNNLLRERLTNALRAGQAWSFKGEVDTEGIETDDLKRAIDSGKEFKSSLTIEMQSLLEAAEHVLVLRKYHKEGDMVALHDYLQLIAENNRSTGRKISPLAIDEVASILRALHNEMSLVALRCSLEAFVIQNHKTLPAFVQTTSEVSESFLHIVGNPMYYEFSRTCSSLKGVEGGGKSYPALHTVAKISYVDGENENDDVDPRRHYCYDNMHRSDVSSDSIETILFDEALMIAKDRGVYGTRAKSLLRTVLMMRQVRIAMRAQDWHKVDRILSGYSVVSRPRSLGHVSGYGFDPDTMLPDDLDRACALEVYVIQHQLEMRAAILDVYSCLQRGWAKCSNGIVEIDDMEVEELEVAVARCKSSIEDAAEEGAEHGGVSDESEAAGESKSPSGGGVVSGITARDEGEQGKIFSLLHSASIVSRARRFLSKGMLKEAGELASAAVDTQEDPADAAVAKNLLRGDRGNDDPASGQPEEDAVPIHEAVHEELQLYAAEVHCALKLTDLVSTLRAGISEGNSRDLESLIISSRAMLLQKSLRLNDLGLVRVLQRAQTVYSKLLKGRQVLQKSLHVYDTKFVRRALDEARALHLHDEDLMAKADSRLAKLQKFEALVAELSGTEGGVISNSAKFHRIVMCATDLDLLLHPVALKAEVGRHLNYASLRRLHLGEALSSPAALKVTRDDNGEVVVLGSRAEGAGPDQPFTVPAYSHGLPYASATHTMRLKRAYLSHREVRDMYNLDSFAPLRDKVIFSLRMGVSNQLLQATMLSHGETNLPTSLTALRPELAALAVWVFAHVIRGLENSIFTRPEVRLRDLVRLGREVPAMRDEMLLQIVKQLTDNPEELKVARMWRCLAACLAHFSCSAIFENYLELYLIRSVESTETKIAAQNKRLTEMRSSKAPPVVKQKNLARGSVGDSMAPSKSQKKDNSLAQEEEEEEKRIFGVLTILRQNLAWAKHCVRLLHEGCFLFGYNTAILTAFDDSLSRFLLWLSEPQAVVLMLRCQASPSDGEENPEKWNQILCKVDRNTGFTNEERTRQKERADKAIAKALATVFEDPGWTDDVSTQVPVNDDGSSARDYNAGITDARGGNSGDTGGDNMMKMQGISQEHLSKSAFTMGASLFGKANTIDEGSETRQQGGDGGSAAVKASQSVPFTSSSKGAMTSSGKGSNSNQTQTQHQQRYKFFGELLGGNGKLYGSHNFWSSRFNDFVNSRSHTNKERQAILSHAVKDSCKKARRVSKMEMAQNSRTGTSPSKFFASIPVVEEEEEEEGEEVEKGESDEEKNENATAHDDEEDSSDQEDYADQSSAASKGGSSKHLVLQKVDFLTRLCDMCLVEDGEVGMSRVDLSLEDEILRFLIGEEAPTRSCEAERWYNYHTQNGKVSTNSPFFSSEENEQSQKRMEWFRTNLTIPDEEDFARVEGGGGGSDTRRATGRVSSAMSASGRKAVGTSGKLSGFGFFQSLEDDGNDNEGTHSILKKEQNRLENAAPGLAGSESLQRVSIRAALFWEKVVAPACTEFGLSSEREGESGSTGGSAEAKRGSSVVVQAKRGSTMATQYLKNLAEKHGLKSVGIDMALYRDLVQAGTVLFVEQMRATRNALQEGQSVLEENRVLRVFRDDTAPSSSKAVSSGTSGAAAAGGFARRGSSSSRVRRKQSATGLAGGQVFHMYTRSQNALDAEEKIRAERQMKPGEERRSRASAGVKFKLDGE